MEKEGRVVLRDMASLTGFGRFWPDVVWAYLPWLPAVNPAIHRQVDTPWGLMWFNSRVNTVEQRNINTRASDSPVVGEIRGGIAFVNECHEGRVLQGLYFLPNGARNRQGKEALDVLAQPLWFLKETGANRIVRAAHMQNYENDKHFLLGRHLRVRQISAGIEDARQLRLRVHAFPQVAMLLRQLDEICHATSPGLKQERNAYQKEPRGDSACLSEREPIVANPVRRGHYPIIPNLRPVSSV
jgi:hypothetical protein